MAAADKGPSAQLQAFIEREQQLAQMQQMIATLTEVSSESVSHHLAIPVKQRNQLHRELCQAVCRHYAVYTSTSGTQS